MADEYHVVVKGHDAVDVTLGCDQLPVVLCVQFWRTLVSHLLHPTQAWMAIWFAASYWAVSGHEVAAFPKYTEISRCVQFR